MWARQGFSIFRSSFFVIQQPMGKLITKAEIFSKKSLDPRSIYVEEWGGEVLYRPMSMVQRREVRKKCSSVETVDGETKIEMDAEKLEVLAVIYCVLDPGDEARNKLMFNPDDIDVLESQMTAGAISTVAQAILRDSGMAGNQGFRGEKKAES